MLPELKRICKNKCIQHKAKKPSSGSRYSSGQVRCQICEIFMTYKGINKVSRCKCCNFLVRTKPRNKTYKEKYRMNTS